MNDGLKALEDFRRDNGYGAQLFSYSDLDIVEQELKRLEKLESMYSNCVIEGAKQKKALEIIKRESVDILALDESENLFMYNQLKRNLSDLTQEEFNLLKEVLL